MVDLLSLHKYFLEPYVKEGATCVDFTMGNGHDTLFLSKSVGENGRVFAFDVQEQALASTKKLLTEEKAPENYTLILDSHANLKKHVSCEINAGVFNLGWLPGSDKKITTQTDSTLAAVTDAMSLMAHDSIILIAVYPGHEEGKKEGNALDDLFSGISRFEFCIGKFRIVNSASSPFFYTVEKK